MLPLLSLLSLTALLPPTGPTDSLVIFNANRTYHYRALFISPTGDTLSRERVTFQPSGKPWIQKTQTAFRVTYNYTSQDSATFSTRLNPQSKDLNKPQKYKWSRNDNTGAIENKEQVWIHPIRNNQYNYTEVAPFPEVQFATLRAGGSWQPSPLHIMMGWGAFKGKLTRAYQVQKQETRQYGSVVMPGCWLIQAVGEHSKLGKSYLDFYFHPQYGFTEMHYRFYDGTKIDFVLEQVLDKRQQ